jgi:putative SOS response-associated peptidase YedK
MCGRLSLTASGEELAEVFGLEEKPEIEARYNIAPTQPLATVRASIVPVSNRRPRQLAWTSWGVIPKVGQRRLVINIRAEGLGTRSPFREAFLTRRCLIPTSGFYEWTGEREERRAHYFHLPGHRPFAFAGLWEASDDPAVPPTAAILTVPPNEAVAPIHDRMPAILTGDDWDRWLDPEAKRASDLRDLLRPYAGPPLAVYPVGRGVNDAKNEGPSLVVPDTTPAAQGRLF